jgi:hypothetical protein
MWTRIAARLLTFKPGTGTYVGGGFGLFLCMIFAGQYFSTGRLDVKQMVDGGLDLTDFWVRNPRLKFVDSYPRTSLIQVRDVETGRRFLVDAAAVRNAEVRPQPCEDHVGDAATLAYPDSMEVTCFGLILPNDATPAYRSAVSFKVKAKDSDVQKYYQNLFRGLGKKVSPIVESSRVVTLEAEDGAGETFGRISIRSSFDTCYGFLTVIANPPAAQ